MKKIKLRVSTLYAVYKQTIYIFLLLACLVLALFFPIYSSVFLLIGVFFLLRITYGIIYYKRILFELYEDRLNVYKGVFSYSKDFLELYRVKDYEVSQSFFMQIFGLMNATLITSDKSDPKLKMAGIPKSDIIDIIREYVEIQRKKKGVREFD